MLKLLWERWKHLAHLVGNFQARLLLMVVYALLVLPFGLAVRWFADPLGIRRRPSEWHRRSDELVNMGWAQRQW